MVSKRKRKSFERYPKLVLTVFVLVAVCLCDFLAGFFFNPIDYNSFRIPHPLYHHDLESAQETITKWGDREYPFLTNSLGFRDGTKREVPKKSANRRIMFMGDSFTEGVGVTFEESFIGVLSKKPKLKNIELLNGGVLSYSPLLYYLKTRFLIEERGVKFDELIVFIDISDIQNEISYLKFEPYVGNKTKKIFLGIKGFLYHRSLLFNRIYNLVYRDNQKPHSFNPFVNSAQLEEEISDKPEYVKQLPLWTIDSKIFEAWGKRGLQLAESNMSKLVELCATHKIAMTIVVYPWPTQIFARDFRSIQVSAWSKFSENNGVKFINLFPLFINDMEPIEVMRQYFTKGDIHWNISGHQLVADDLYYSYDW